MNFLLIILNIKIKKKVLFNNDVIGLIANESTFNFEIKNKGKLNLTKPPALRID